MRTDLTFKQRLDIGVKIAEWHKAAVLEIVSVAPDGKLEDWLNGCVVSLAAKIAKAFDQSETGDDLIERMRGSGIGCYKGQDGNYYLERGAGSVSRSAIDDALRRGLIKPKWDDAPHLEYWRIA